MTIQERPGGRVVEYPTSDGKTMAESDLHRDIAYLRDWGAEGSFRGAEGLCRWEQLPLLRRGKPSRVCLPRCLRWLRLWDPNLRQWILSREELAEEYKAERQRAETEAFARANAEAELARLRAELASLRSSQSS